MLSLLHKKKGHSTPDGMAEELVALDEEVEQLYSHTRVTSALANDTTTQNSFLETEVDSSRFNVFAVSMRIFFERALCSSDGLSSILDNAFWVLDLILRNTNCSAPRGIPPLSLFLIGVEARDECERKTVLDLLEYFAVEAERWEQTEGQMTPAVGFRTTGMNHAMELLKKVWVQEDLSNAAEGHQQYLGYKGKLCRALSSSSTLPCLL